MARDPGPQRGPDAAMEGRDLSLGQLSGRPLRMDLRPPERLISVDVPHPSKSALVEDGGLDRSLAPCERFAETARGESWRERLAAEPLREVRVDFTRLDEQPGSEPADVPVDDVRSVV